MKIIPMPQAMTFEALRRANLKRIPLFKNSKGKFAHLRPDGSDWSLGDWMTAIVGELGELANWQKKFKRGDISRRKFLREARKELADVTTYLDIYAAQLNINLGEVVVSKFNEVSERVGADVSIKNGYICDQCIKYKQGDPHECIGPHPMCSAECTREWMEAHE